MHGPYNIKSVDVYFHSPYGQVFTLWCVGVGANLEINSPSGGIVCSGGSSGGNTYLSMVSAPERRHHTQETWTTAEVAHLPLKMG
jgi:hypothetical protein